MTFQIERGILKQYIGTDSIVQIPDGVTEIGYRAFYGNHSVQTVILPEGVVKIGSQAFCGCDSLNEIVFPDSLRIVGWEAFVGTEWMDAQPDGIVYAGRLALRIKGELCNMISAEIKPGTVKLCADLFRNCTALTDVLLPDSLTEIDDRAFQHCRRLKMITIPEQAVRIGDRAFDECTKLSVQLHCRDAAIGRHCFMDDASLHVYHMNPAKLPNNVRDSAVLAFANDMYEDTVQDEAFAMQMRQYIQNRRRQYYPLAIKHWNLLQMMIQNRMIPAEDVDAILDEILLQGQADHAAALMRYKQSLAEDEADWLDDAWDDLTLDWDLPQAAQTTEQLERAWGMKQNVDGTYTLMRYYGDALDVVVPAQIGDKIISAIGPYALSPLRYGIGRERAVHLERIRAVTIEEGITRIGNHAFAGCSALSDITIPQSVEHIGRNAMPDRN